MQTGKHNSFEVPVSIVLLHFALTGGIIRPKVLEIIAIFGQERASLSMGALSHALV